MRKDWLILVVGSGAEAVNPVRQALEQSGIFAVACCDLNASILNGSVADLEIICVDSASCEVTRAEFGTRRRDSEAAGATETQPSEALQRVAHFARHPVPVIFIHPRPTIDDVNFLRSNGAYYVLDRRHEERTQWRGLLECVFKALEMRLVCSFCGRELSINERWVTGSGQARLCRNCLFELVNKIAHEEYETVRYVS